VASLKQIKPRLFEDSKIEFVKVAQRKFFGMETAKEGFPVSTITKTVVDCLDKPKFSGGFAEAGIVLGSALTKIEIAEVVDVAIQNSSISTMQRLGFYLDTIRPDLLHSSQREKLLKHIGSNSRSRIGKAEATEGDFGYQGTWQLQVNLDKAAFLGEVDRFRG
jgi:predicted transcriptional regulator of viral defense system